MHSQLSQHGFLPGNLVALQQQGRKLYIDAGKDLKIHKISKISKSVTLLKKIDLEMLPHLKSGKFHT